MTITGRQNYVPLTRNFCATHGGTDCKELEIETEHEMEIVFYWLLFFASIPTLKGFIVTYLNQPQPAHVAS